MTVEQLKAANELQHRIGDAEALLNQLNIALDRASRNAQDYIFRLNIKDNTEEFAVTVHDFELDGPAVCYLLVHEIGASETHLVALRNQFANL